MVSEKMIYTPAAPDDALWQNVPIASEAWYYPLGYRLCVQTNAPIVQEMARRAFARYPASLADPSSPPLRLRLWVHDLDDPAASPSGPHAHPIHRLDGDTYFVMVGAGTVVASHHTRGEATGYVTPAVAQREDVLRVGLVEGPILYLVGPPRTAVFHAAALARGERGFILVGYPGSGKSTMTYACVRRGYGIVAEDAIFVPPKEGPLTIWGMARYLYLLPDSTRFFPELRNRTATVQLNGEMKIVVDLDEIRPGATQLHAGAGPLVLLRRNSGPDSRLVACNPADVLQDMMFTASRAHQRMTEEVLALHRRVADRLAQQGAFTLYAGSDLDKAVDELDRLVASS
ncbi:MAG: hypothetical protein IT330_08040 [Anaerolineae bacterium]|nr:hypothetical protein [Anaerolineae bacterium]